MSHRNRDTSSSQAAADATSPSLLGKAKAGEDEAWRRLVDLYSPLLYTWCRRQGLQAEDAKDVAQDVFASVAKSIESFRRDRPGDSFRGWLWTITSHKIRDHFRRRNGQAEARGGTDAQIQLAELPEESSGTSFTSPPGGHCSNAEQRAIELARAGVEERTWQAFWRVAVEGEDVAEVAKALGITTQAVYDAKYRIRRKIRQELESLGEAAS